MIKTTKMLFAVLFSAIALFATEPSYAGDLLTPQNAPSNSVANTLKLVKDSAIKISEKMSDRATDLLWGLALISLSILAIKQIFSGADFNTLFAEMIKFIMGIGFFVWILDPHYIGVGKLITFVEDWLNIIPTNGVSNATPEEFIVNMFSQGWKVLCTVASFGADANLLDFIFPVALAEKMAEYILSLILASAIFIIFLCLTVNFILTLTKAYITICCGILAVGFGGLTWTNSWAVNYLKQLVKLGLELMCFVFIVSVLLSMVETIIQQPQDQDRPIELSETFLIFTESLIILMLAHSVPSAVTSMFEGGATGSSAMSAASQAKVSKDTAKLAMGGAGMAMKGASKLKARLAKNKNGSVDIKPNSSSSDSKE